jgi:transcription elongation factor Elf1
VLRPGSGPGGPGAPVRAVPPACRPQERQERGGHRHCPGARRLPLGGDDRMRPTVRDDAATMTCGFCGASFTAVGRRRWCSVSCRQAAWRARRAAVPTPPRVPRSATVYECGNCGARYLGSQRCEECNTWCYRVGPGAECPHCNEPVAVSDLIDQQMVNQSRFLVGRK